MVNFGEAEYHPFTYTGSWKNSGAAHLQKAQEQLEKAAENRKKLDDYLPPEFTARPIDFKHSVTSLGGAAAVEEKKKPEEMDKGPKDTVTIDNEDTVVPNSGSPGNSRTTLKFPPTTI